MGIESSAGSKDLLFLKKKKQKDFSPFAPRRLSHPGLTNESFLVFFFKKEHASFPSPASP
jgi:hypothetical protein